MNIWSVGFRLLQTSSNQFYVLNSGRRTFGLTARRNGIFDPFRPKKEKYNEDVKEFFAEKSKSSSLGNKSTIIKDEPNILGRIVQNMFNPKPINARLREQHNLADTYKLVYIMPNERLMLFMTLSSVLIFPALMATVFAVIVAELSGRARFGESFENTFVFLSFFLFWSAIAAVTTVRMRQTAVTRIYHDAAAGKFVLFRPRGAVRFVREDFAAADVILRSDKRAKQLESRLVAVVTKLHGNVFINGRLRQIDFKHFSSDKVLEAMVGKENFVRIKVENRS